MYHGPFDPGRRGAIRSVHALNSVPGNCFEYCHSKRGDAGITNWESAEKGDQDERESGSNDLRGIGLVSH
jgi:hypothetical protein